jgi:pimeloyl-ACP methyl ester carboxylesterase
MSTPRAIFLAAALVAAALLVWQLNRGPNAMALSRVSASPDGLGLSGDGTMIIAALPAPAMSPAHVAAGIAYEDTPRPAGLPDDMQPQPGAGLRFLSISAIDGFRVAAALWQPLAKPAASTTLLVQVHGSGGNLASLQLRATARTLSPRGFAALSISTRQHDKHVNTDNFFEVRRDIEAAVATAKALGYGAIVLQGHSLGTAQVAFYAATDWDPAIRGLVLTGAIAKLPWKARPILVQDEDAYRTLAQAARDAVRAGRPEATLAMPMPWIGGRPAPVTARHFLTYRDEAASAADTTFWIARIPRPILLVRDAADGVVLPFEPYMLLSAARAEGSLVPQIRYVLLPNPRPPSVEGHIFADNTGPLAEAIASWLAECGL